MEDKDIMRWYIAHTYSGCEQRAKQTLEELVKMKKMDTYFDKILVPSENVVEMIKGEKKTKSKKIFPGYLLIRMRLTNETWHLVKSVPKISGFIGNGTTPYSIPDSEIDRVTQQISDGSLRPKMKIVFEKGESVRVIDGPFSNFNGIVDEVKPDKGKVRVLVSIFGRSTPIELEFSQVEKN